MVRRGGGAEACNIAFHFSEIAPAERRGANVNHAAVVLSVALAAGQVMKFGDIGAEMTRCSFDSVPRQSCFAWTNDSSGDGPGRSAMGSGVKFFLEAADAVHYVVVPRSFAQLAVADDIDADFDLAHDHIVDSR